MSDRTVIRPAFHHVNLKTTRLQEMIDFYSALVGCEVLHQYEMGAWISNDAANHRIALLAFPELHRRPAEGHAHRPAPHRVRVRELRGARRQLPAAQGRGDQPAFCLDHGMTFSYYYSDPDGNHVELQIDNFGDWAKSGEWMRTSPEFAADPLGKFVDPDRVSAARAEGASFAEIHTRAMAGELAPRRAARRAPRRRPSRCDSSPMTRAGALRRASCATARSRRRRLAARAARLAGAEIAANGDARRRGHVRLLPPVPDPQKIICMGLNYRDHAEEAHQEIPANPLWFAKFANSLVGDGAPVVLPAAHAELVDYEAELAVVIGREARGIAEADALDHVAGVMPFNDVSARDLQLQNPLWTSGKAIDTFAPCGPALVTLDEIDDVQDLTLRTRINGAVVQEGTTANMIFGVAETIAWLSRTMTLLPGDIVATGTPAGVGAFQGIFLRDGNTVEVEVEGVGTVSNPVQAA